MSQNLLLDFNTLMIIKPNEKPVQVLNTCISDLHPHMEKPAPSCDYGIISGVKGDSREKANRSGSQSRSSSSVFISAPCPRFPACSLFLLLFSSPPCRLLPAVCVFGGVCVSSQRPSACVLLQARQ